MKKYFLLGKDISLSLSPKIHNTIFKILGIDAVYDLMPLSNIQDFTKIDIISENIGGFNVTTPFKNQICPFVNDLSCCKSVNTVALENGQKNGYSTDGDGFILDANRLNLNTNRVLILGNGGAAHSIINSLVKQKNSRIFVLSRNFSSFNDEFLTPLTNLESIISQHKITLTINCTGSNFPNYGAFYDLGYKNASNPQTHNGLGMLIYQAILSQQIFQKQSLDLEIFNEIKARLK